MMRNEFFFKRSNGFDKLTTSGFGTNFLPLVLSSSKDSSRLKKTYKMTNIFILLIILLIPCVIGGDDSFVVKSKKKSEPKVTLEDCMSNILDEHQSCARINVYGGTIQAYQLNWVEQIFNEEKNAFLKKASQEQLQKYLQEQQLFKDACQQFEQASRTYKDFITRFEQEVSGAKASK